MKPRIILIANPVARAASEKKIRRAADLFHFAGRDVEVFLSDKKGDAEEIAWKAAKEGASLIVAAGGDGTLNEVINGIVHTEVPMAILPMGTTNVLAKELGIPEDVEGAANRALNGKPHTVSLGKIMLDHTPVSRHFCLMAGIGFDASAVYEVDSSVKRFSGRMAYIVSGVKALQRYSPHPLTFSIDGEEHVGYSAIVGKASKYGGNLRITPDASLLNPELYICLMKGKRRSDVLRYVFGILTGRHIGFEDVIYRKARSVRVEGDAHVQIDGDYLGRTPATITVAPDALRIVF